MKMLLAEVVCEHVPVYLRNVLIRECVQDRSSPEARSSTKGNLSVRHSKKKHSLPAANFAGASPNLHSLLTAGGPVEIRNADAGQPLDLTALASEPPSEPASTSRLLCFVLSVASESVQRSATA